MEKKQNLRNHQLPSKVLSSESRKTNQDAPGKQQARNSRRRECSSNFTQAPKSDRSTHNVNKSQHKQQQLQIFAPKSRGGDGRRGGGGASGGGRTANNNDGYTGMASASGTGLNHFGAHSTESINDDFETEMNSVYLPGSKKQNLNHLLNFNYMPRDRTDAMTFQRSGNNGVYVKRTKYNKEQYLQANCQFVVKSKGDYAPYTLSPDVLVEWASIEQIHFFGSSEEPQCPICLYHPVAAKMTRCGHVYCWPCILHYLALSDKKSWRKCPICYEAVHIGDLKSAVSIPHRNYVCNETVTFELMCRSKNSLQVQKSDGCPSKLVQFPSLSSIADVKNHSKLLLAEPHEILSIIERERCELRCQLVSDGIDCPDSIFVQQALVLLEEREAGIRAQLNGDGKKNSIAEVVEDIEKISLNADAKEFVPFEQKETEMAADDLGDFVIDNNSELTVEDIDIVPVDAASNDDYLYFYQSNDGQHLYLHSINVRMLQTMYTALKHAPKSITGRILQKESCSMTEELRKRLKYLQHLPVTCQFDVVEIELDSPAIISEEVYYKFKDEVKQRQNNRQKRAREERKRERHIDRENDRRIGKFIHTNINIDVNSVQQFPSCGYFDDSSFPMHNQPQAINQPGTSAASDSAANNPGPSFAKMLTSPLSASKSENWPTLGRPKETAIFASSPTYRSSNDVINPAVIYHSDEDSIDLAIDDIESAYARPEFNESFGSAITEALNRAAHSKHTIKPKADANNLGGGKKKKPVKKTILFSTGSRTFDGN